MSRRDPECPEARPIVRQLDEPVHELTEIGSSPSTWYGELKTKSDPLKRTNRSLDYEPIPGSTADVDSYPNGPAR
jgi:hypothetical protein